MDSESSSASWWLHREEPESPSPTRYDQGLGRGPYGRDSARPLATGAGNPTPGALSIENSPEFGVRQPRYDTPGAGDGVFATRPAAFVVHQAPQPVRSAPDLMASPRGDSTQPLPPPIGASTDAMSKLQHKCVKYKQQFRQAMDDNRVLAEEVQRLREQNATLAKAKAASSAPATSPTPAPPVSERDGVLVQQLKDRVRVLEQERDDQHAQVAQLTSSENALGHVNAEIAACWPVLRAVVDDGEQFISALHGATQYAQSPEVATVSTRLPDVEQCWHDLHQLTLKDPPGTLHPSLEKLRDTLTEERDVVAHLARVLLASQAPETLRHISAVTDTRLREMEEEHMAEMEESQRIIRELEKRLAAANSLRRLPWSALGTNGVMMKGAPGAGLDSISPYTPLVEDRSSGYVSAATSVVVDGKPSTPAKSDAATQTAVSMEFVMAAAHAVTEGTSRSARRSKELDLIDIMTVEMESLRAELENAKSQLAVLLEQRRRFLGQVDAPLDYSTRVGLVRSTGFNVLHHGDTN